MVRRAPHYYEKFQCIASSCKDNCCTGGWEIDIDDETAEHYLEIEGTFGDRLRASIRQNDDNEYCFGLNDGCCPFLDSANLCEIYQNLGEDKMGVVCTQFPRFTEYFGNIKEMGIGLACEEAANIIISDQAAFSTETTLCEEGLVKDPEYDAVLADQLFIVREQLMAFIENKDFSLSHKVINLIKVCNDIQNAINHNQYESIGNISIHNYNVHKQLENSEYSVQEAVERVLCAYTELEPLNEQWTAAIDHVFEVLHPEEANILSRVEYVALIREFGLCIQSREQEYLNLLKYFIFRYFMKAAYDHDVIGKAQLTVSALLVIHDMELVRWLDNGKKFSFQDRMDIIHIFSREVEYSEDNLEDLSEEFVFDDIFMSDQLAELIAHVF